MTKAILTILLALAATTGCTSNPYDISNRDESIEYTVNAPFDVAYERLQIGAKRCFEARSGVIITVSAGMIDTDKARINANITNTIAVLDISKIDDNTTHVRGTWHASVGRIWYRYVVASQNWAKGLYHKCQANPEDI